MKGVRTNDTINGAVRYKDKRKTPTFTSGSFKPKP